MKQFFLLCFIFGSLLLANSQDLAKNSIANANLDTNSSENLDLNALKSRLLNAKIYENPKWLVLLHYDKSKSAIAKSSNFFLSKNGHKSPKDEYIATIEKFFAEMREIQNAQGREIHSTNTPIDAQANQTHATPTKANNGTSAPTNAKDTKPSTPTSQIQSTNTTQSLNLKNLENSVLCQYPARLYFIAQNLGDKRFLQLIDTSKCAGLNEFLDIVPIERIFIEFAAESEIYPGSSMGHIFLHLQGFAQKDIKKDFGGAPFVRQKGDRQDYAMSYFAMMSEFFNPLDYVGALAGSLGGTYALNPYDNAELDYLDNEQRSLYVFRVRANEKQIRLFALHLWELRDKQIAYDFVSHNCTNGIENVLGVLDERFFYATYKPFITPTEYLRYLVNAGAIEFSELKTPPNKQKFIEKFGSNDILRTRKSSKIAFGAASKQGFLYFAPIYSDIKNANNAYKELIESRLASFELRFNGLGNNDKFKPFLHKIELLQLFSVADTLRTKGFSKLISVRFEPNLYAKKAHTSFESAPNKDTRLLPNLDLGLGVGAYAGAFSFYMMGDLGYRYEFIHNPYVSLKSGVVAQFERAKLIGEYQIYYDINANNRGYDSKFSLFAGLNAFKQVDIFAEFQAFHSLFDNDKIFYAKKHLLNLKFGASWNF